MLDPISRARIWGEIEGRPGAAGAVSAPDPCRSGNGEAATDLILDHYGTAFAALMADLRFQLSYQVLTYFRFDEPEAAVQQALFAALERLYGQERQLLLESLPDAAALPPLPAKARGQAPTADAAAHALALIRKCWHHSRPKASNRAGSLLSGLDHIDQAGFFTRGPQEITGWARLFLLTEDYHRLDPLEAETRLDRYRRLQGSAAPIRRPGDVLIWLEQELLHHPEEALDRLARRVASDLAERLAPEVQLGFPLDAQIYLMLRCHQVCAAETWDPADRDRLAQLLASRRMQTLVDLMLLVLDETLGTQPLPEVGTLLDQLQAKGFNIAHEAFRDPYEALLVPLEDTVRFEGTPLRLFLPLATLTGDYARDLALSQERLAGEHAKIIADLGTEQAAYRGALEQPLPQAHLPARIANYLVSWHLSRQSWPVALTLNELVEQVGQTYPEQVRSLLLRPRKGYEIKSRLELTAIIEAACRVQWSSLERIAQQRSVAGLHDYQVLLRCLSLKPLARPEDPLVNPPDPEEMVARAARLGIARVRPTADTPATVAGYLNARVPCQDLLSAMIAGFDMTEQELEQVYQALQDRFSPVLYQLVVAAGRQRAGAPRVAAKLADLERIVELLVPPYQALIEQAGASAAAAFERQAAAGYRRLERPYLLDQSEWEAYLAWVFDAQAHGRNGSGATAIEPNGALTVLRAAAERADSPPRDPLAPSIEALICSWLREPSAGAAMPEAALEMVATLLPQLNCGACGRSGCRAFAEVLLTQHAPLSRCPHLNGRQLSAVADAIAQARRQADDGEQPRRVIDLFQDRRAYRAAPAKHSIQQVLSPEIQKARRLFLDRVERHWRQLEPKPAIFKAPDLETCYQALIGYLGIDAVEKLQNDEIEFLARHGERKVKAEWQALEQARDWLQLARRERESGPLLQHRDPIWQARQAYRGVLYLDQLTQSDRRLILGRRLQQHDDGFAGWWNQDLLTLNHPKFAIGTWDEFAKIIKNAFWHQEQSLVPMELADQALQETDPATAGSDRFRELATYWIEQEQDRLQGGRPVAAADGEGGREHFEPLRRVIERLALELCHGTGATTTFALQSPGAAALEPAGFASEDQELAFRNAVWTRFQQQAVPLPTPFPLTWSGLDPLEQDWFARAAAPAWVDALKQSDIKEGTVPAESTLGMKIAVIQAVIAAAVTRLGRELREKQLIDRAMAATEPPLPLTAPLRSWIRHNLAGGRDPAEVLERCLDLGHRHRPWRTALLREALRRLMVWRHLESLTRESRAVLPAYQPRRDLDLFLEHHPEWRRLLERVPDRPPRLDKERLLHSLFYLAKMEGDLAVLTALLREIRETSDIIEAAWLNFTQERLKEGPYPKTAPGTSLGIPMLHLRVKDKERCNHCLRQGLPRGEKEDLAAAVNELLLVIRCQILSAAQDQTDPAGIAAALGRSGYDLEGIEPAALEAAVARELRRGEQLRADRIWIIASATARRLAAQNSELLELERRFHKIRLNILSDQGSRDQDELLSRRGIALGRIKEAMYRELSDLLEPERVASFRKRIQQIVEELELKRVEIYRSWLDGAINRRSIFYLLRRFQKQPGAASWDDGQTLLRDHWFRPVRELSASDRPDRQQRLNELDERFQALFGVSLLEWQAQAAATAGADFTHWKTTQLARLPRVQPSMESAHD